MSLMRTSTLLPVMGLVVVACSTGADDLGTRASPAFGGGSAAAQSVTPDLAILQQENDRPTTPIEVKTLADLTDNGIGDLFPLDRHPQWGCLPPRKDWAWIHVADLGLTWVQISVDRMDWEQATSQDEYSRFHVNACQDEMVSLFARNGITMLHTIVYWDPELNAERPPDLTSPKEFQLHLDYVRFLVRHFRGRIEYYGILNESWWYVHLPVYLELIRQAIRIIHEEDPEAKIVAGGATDLREQISRDYLFGLLNSDVVSMLDGIILHPLFGESPKFPETAQYYAEYPALVAEIKDVAAAHGFTGEYFTSGMGWRTSTEPHPYEPWGYTPIEKAKYTARAIVMHRGMDIRAGIGVNDTIRPFVRAVRNLSTVLDGAEPTSLGVQIETEAEDVISYGFSLPNGGRLLALWMNGIAVDDDPGVTATLTFPESQATGAIGIDVLEGVQQGLVTGRSGSDLVIEDLLVKDYPIFIRLTE